MSVRILIADDHEVVRRGIRSLLDGMRGIEVCGEARDGREAVEQASKLKPDVVVLDIAMPGMNGLEATREILKALPRTEVLILTVHESEQLVREVLRAGARGYVLKSDVGQFLVASIESVSAHRPYFTSRVSELVFSGYLRGDLVDAAAAGDALTPREGQVLHLIAEGKTNKEIAAALGIGAKTVETHRTSIMAKKDLHSVADLVRYAIRNGLVDP